MKLFRKELEELSCYVPGKPLEEVMESYGLTKVVKLASNENPLGPSPLAIEAIREEAPHVHLYPDPEARALKRALGLELGVEPEQILLGNGGEATIQLVAASVIERGDEVVVPDPGFSLHEITAAHMGGIVRRVPLLEDYSHDLEGMLRAVNDKTKIVYLTNPNNPTGAMVNKMQLEDFASRLPQEVLLFLDEAYFEFAKIDPNYPDGLEILKSRKNTIVLRTFAKVCGIAGLRLGYIVSTPEIICEISKSAGVFSVNRLAQVAGLASLKDKEHVERSVALARASLSRMMEYFDSKGLEYIPAKGNFIFVNIKEEGRRINQELLKKGVIIRPGFLWGWDSWLRVSCGTMENTELFIEALDGLI